MTRGTGEVPSRTEVRPGWLERWAPWVAALAAGGLLGVFQTVLLVARARSLEGGLELLPALAGVGFPVGVATTLLLLPVAYPLSRLGSAAAGRWRASWAASCGLAAAVAFWALADLWTSTLAVGGGLATAIEIVIALLGGALAAAWVRPSPRAIGIGAAATLVGLLVVGAGRLLGGDEGPREIPPPAARMEWPTQRPDVVLITIDTLRVDRLGLYGAQPSLTTEIDRFGAEGAVFHQALASSPWTIPSLASVMTGLPTVRHRAGWPMAPGPTFWRSALNPEFFTLAERFAAAGYRTRAVVANGFISPWTGLDQGFAEFENPFLQAMETGSLMDLPLTRLVVELTPAELWGDFRARGVTDRALSWLSKEVTAPQFLWVHYIDPHSPFQADPDRLDPTLPLTMIRQQLPPRDEGDALVGDVFAATERVRSGTLWLGPEDRRRLVELYDGEVRYTDHQLGRLFAALREHAERRPVVAALTADHGEEFWDHGGFEHGHDYYREVTGVPLIFWSPGEIPAGTALSQQAGLVDVAPTLLDLAGLEVPAPRAPDEGRSLTGLWRGGAEPWRELPRFATGNLYGLPAVLIEEGSWRYLLRANGHEELYDLTTDPGERFNLARQRADLATEYRRLAQPRLDAIVDGLPESDAPELTADELRALRALGYLD